MALASVALALTPLAAGWLDRAAVTVEDPDSALVAWLEHRPDFRDDRNVVAQAPVEGALLSGAHLQHPLELIGRTEPCARIRERAKHEWVVVKHLAFAELRLPFTAAGCDLGRPPVYNAGGYVVWAPTA